MKYKAIHRFVERNSTGFSIESGTFFLKAEICDGHFAWLRHQAWLQAKFQIMLHHFTIRVGFKF